MRTSNHYAYVFEDDAILGVDVFHQTQSILRVIPADWDVILLGCKCLSCENFGKYDKVKKFFYTHAMLLNKKGVKKIINYLDDILIEQQIDAVLGEMAEKNMISIYCTTNAISKQNENFQTTIQIPVKQLPGIDPFDGVQQNHASMMTDPIL
jgi:hypothetical protein